MTGGLCERCHENIAATNDEWCGPCILEIELAMAEIEEPVEVEPFKVLPTNYTLEDVERRVAEYEDEYGLTSDALVEMNGNDMAPVDLTSFDRHVWLTLYRELLEYGR